MTEQKFLRKMFEWVIIYCYNVARGSASYFPLPGPNHSQNILPKRKILNVFWTSIASKRRIERFNFSNWFLNVKNLVPSNGS